MIARTPSCHSATAAVQRGADVGERVDVEARVDLVEDRELRAQHAELDDLAALSLAAGEVDVERALEEVVAQPHRPSDRRDALGQVPERHAGVRQRGLGGDPGDLHGLLEREEQPRSRALVRRQPEQVDPVERAPPAR